MNNVEAIDVSKVYWDGQRRLDVLKNVNFSLSAGQSVAILGPSGCGKSTFLNVLSGLDDATSGKVRLCGEELALMSADKKAEFRNQKLGFIFQFYHLLPELNALENVILPLWIAGSKSQTKDALSKAKSLLERVGLKDRMTHFPSELSGGEQQRVAVARALVCDPEIIFCDEPTGNLDPQTASGVMDMIFEVLKDQGKSVLIVTHDKQLADRADKVWNMVGNCWE